MKLSTYMQMANIKDAQLAEKVGRERSTVTRWRRGETKPDFDAMMALEKVTEGAVTYRDFANAETAA